LKKTLRRSEIVRGFKSFENILTNGIKLEYENLTAFIIVNEIKSDPILRVGFLLSKKKLKNLTIETA
jgi:hypothetical protein